MAEKHFLYVIEIATPVAMVLGAEGEQPAAYVGSTSLPVEERLTTHLSAQGSAGRCFIRASKLLGRALSPEDAWLRMDLVTERPSGDSRAQAESAERRQANKLKARGWRIFSGHEHAKRSVRKRRARAS